MDDSVEGERLPSRGPGCSASLPGKTKGIISSSHVCVSDPQIELVDSAFAFEARPFPRLAVHDETALGGVDNPVPVVACLTYCGKGATHLRDLVDDLESLPLFVWTFNLCWPIFGSLPPLAEI